MIWVPFTLTVIAIDRYLMVASPFRQQMSVRACLLLILGIWISPFIVLTPAIANLEYIEFSCVHKVYLLILRKISFSIVLKIGDLTMSTDFSMAFLFLL